MFKKLKTLPQLDIALRAKVSYHAKRGKKYSPKVPPILHPKGDERQYTRQLQKSFTLLFELVKDRVINALPGLVEKYAVDLAPQRFDTAEDDLRLILDGILVEFGRRLTQNEISNLAKQRGLSVSEYNKLQNKKVYKRLLEVDVFTEEPWLENALENFASENTKLITTLSERHINEVRVAVIDGFKRGATAKELELIIARRINKRTRANYRLIARDQVSKLNGQLTRLRQKDIGVKKYVWRTSLDERVRPTHRVKEGKTYSWDDPPPDTGHPGYDYQCRCYAEPILEDLIE